MRPCVAVKKKAMSREFKRMCRDMMGEMRRFSTVDLHGRSLGDEAG